MGPFSIAAAIAILAPYLPKIAEGAAGKVGGLAIDAVRPLYELIRKKFQRDGDDEAQTTLARLVEDPDAKDLQASAVALIQKKAAGDPDFAAQLERTLTQIAVFHPEVNQGVQNTLNISGDSQVITAVVASTQINPQFGGTFEARRAEEKK